MGVQNREESCSIRIAERMLQSDWELVDEVFDLRFEKGEPVSEFIQEEILLDSVSEFIQEEILLDSVSEFVQEEILLNFCLRV